jgi:hypothetical protein
MKKIMLSILSVSSLLLLTGLSGKSNSGDLSGNYLGSDYKGNYIWGGAMNLAWNELNESILKEKLKLNTKNAVALDMVEKLNHPIFTKNDLDKESYYIKSGYGQETVDIINKESKKKFPDKSFEDLNLQLGQTDIISYAYFLKKVEYLTAFEKANLLFEGKKVKGFQTKNKEQSENIKIITYENDDKFIISLQLKGKGDQLILAKGYDMNTPENVLSEMKKTGQGSLQNMGFHDFFAAPELHLNYNRTYQELLDISLANKGFESYRISSMFENIRFDMDEKGARVENEAVITLSKSIAFDKRNFILNKPYWVIMQRKESSNPYFILGVRNVEFMEKQ